MIISKRGQFEVIKSRNLPKIGAAKHKVGGSKLNLMGQLPQEVVEETPPTHARVFSFHVYCGIFALSC